MRLVEFTRPKSISHAMEILQGAGYKPLGMGSFGAVYQKPGASYVLKLFDSADVGYQQYIALAQKNPNPHFPKFFGKMIKVTEDYYAVRMERLEQASEAYSKEIMLIDEYVTAKSSREGLNLKKLE